MDQTAHNLQQQIELYGEPLGETVRRVMGPLGLTQGGLAQVIGLSAPMLSQLVSAQRVKIGNPAVMSRLRAASELADLAIASEIWPHEIPDAIDRIRATSGALTTSGQTKQAPSAGGAPPYATPPGLDAQPPGGAGANVASGMHSAWPTGAAMPSDEGGPAPRVVVRAIQDLLREVASADEIQRAAAVIATESPALAELLLAYGTGRTADALAHYEEHHG
ncbi:DNA-binding protein [Kribbella sp. NBC_00709]|uniref:DNA-binding protein n=1 Tax=Kribbella sp. NBC_00709 TaxID=2975972 RepID=UPI002E2A00CB|nr:DNA-binding protein [Kribbella sp. NBC_00709]